MKKHLFALLFVFTCNANLLRQSETLSPKQIEDLANNWSTQFTWHWKYIAESTFTYENQKAGFAIKLLKIPLYWHQYRMLPTKKEIKGYLASPAYLFAQPLRIENGAPREISLEEVIDIVKTKSVLFYTGAGISASSNVATMNDLMQSLEMHNGSRHFLKEAWQHPYKMIQAFSQFCQSAINAEPTPAHYALTQLALKIKTSIITENVDLLHQRTGIMPIFAYSDALRQISEEELRSIDAIICIGLSHDDRGFLAWYKQHNPKGTLISIDLKQPNYLSENDYLLLEDIQKLIPELFTGTTAQ